MSINDYPAKLTGTAYYYVRTAWEDESTQLGQYRTLKSAIAKTDANPGSHVFTGEGLAIYPEDEDTGATAEGTVTTSESTEEITQDEPESAETGEGKRCCGKRGTAGSRNWTTRWRTLGCSRTKPG